MGGSTASVYRPRRPLESPLYRLVGQHFDALTAVHEERFQSQHGRRRGSAQHAVEKFLDCGVLGQSSCNASSRSIRCVVPDAVAT